MVEAVHAVYIVKKCLLGKVTNEKMTYLSYLGSRRVEPPVVIVKWNDSDLINFVNKS